MAYIKNLDKLTAKIENLSKADLTKALNKACILVENDAKVNCPVDTGALRSSITHEVDGNIGVIGSNLEYSVYVEIGTGLYSSMGNGRQTPWRYKTADGRWHTTSGCKAQPFLQPALVNNESKIKDILIEEMKEKIK